MPGRLSRKKASKSRSLVVIDLSERTTRATLLKWTGEDFAVRDYSFLEAPGLAGKLTRVELAAHFRTVVGSLSGRCRDVVIALGMQDVLVRSLELPKTHDTEFRAMVKLNTNKYFQQDSSQLVVDCFPVTSELGGIATNAKDAHVVAVGAKQELFRVIVSAARDAGLHLLRITATQASLANAVRFAQPETFGNQVVAIIEFGPRTCAVTAAPCGQPALTRVIDLDDATATGLDEAFATPYPVADEIRGNLIRNRLQKTLFPVGREISAAIDYFEAQLNCRITTALFNGGTERADLTLETLQGQLDVPCERIDISSIVKVEVSNGKGERAARELQRLGGCIGAAAAECVPTLVQINLLAERLEAQAAARRDPVRLCTFAAVAALVCMLAWAGYIRVDLNRTANEVQQLDSQLNGLKTEAADALRITSAAHKLSATLAALDQHSTNRFLVAPALDGLQETMVEDVQVVNLTVQQTLQTVPGVKPSRKPGGKRTPAKKGFSTERSSLVIHARNFGDTKAADQFMDLIANQEYFKSNLRKVDPVTLKSRTAKQADPLEPEKVYTLFTIECAYPERILGHE